MVRAPDDEEEIDTHNVLHYGSCPACGYVLDNTLKDGRVSDYNDIGTEGEEEIDAFDVPDYRNSFEWAWAYILDDTLEDTRASVPDYEDVLYSARFDCPNCERLLRIVVVELSREPVEFEETFDIVGDPDSFFSDKES